MPSGGRAEIENATKWAIIYVFQFQLCHQMGLFKCCYTFGIYGHLDKNDTFKFLKDGLVKK